jgi:carboxymethylenebutenolidase
MERKTTEDFDPELLILFDAYVHGDVDRRGFLDRAAKFAVGSMTAGMLLDALTPKFAEAQQVAKDDKRLKTEYVEYDSPNGNGKMRGYLARPASATGKLPGIIVIHENRGLNPHIEDVGRRLALENFMTFAPDALFPLGGYPGDEDKARELFPKLDQAKTREDFVTAAHWLMKRSDCTGKVGAVGFCWGGSMSNTLASRVPELAGAVPFYGGAPNAEDAARVKGPLLLQFAETDQRVNASWPPYEEVLKANKVKYEAFIYPGTQHGFNNDTTPRYNAEAAKLAWTRTVEFFKKNLA